MHTTTWLQEAAGEQAAERFGNDIRERGYEALRRLIDQLKDAIKHGEDEEMPAVEAALANARKAVPNPGTISPAWHEIWQQLAIMTAKKKEVLEAFPARKRDGEWQVLLDNPYVHQDVVCYPALSFLEAAYLYAYFYPDLQKNEYVRIQKVETVLMEFGRS